MNIAVVAANGRSGQAVVEAALAAGHTVRAGVRGPHGFGERPGLVVVPCDATKTAEVEALLQGAQAVVSMIGHVKGSPATVQTQAMRTIVAAMPGAGVNRIVSLTGTGVRFAGDHITLLDRILNVTIGIIDPARVADGRQHVEVLKASVTEWTVLRVLKLANGGAQPFHLLEHGPTRGWVSRATVAAAVLEVLEQHSFVQQAPIIGD